MKRQFNIRHIVALCGMTAMIIASFTGCNKDDDKNSGASCDFREEMAALLAAQENYHDDPSVSNCNAYKSAALEVEARIKGCPAIEKEIPASLRAEIEAYRDYDCSASDSD